MKRLIVNADDLGWSEAVTGGILQAHARGVLTSTTVMANLPGAAEALERARREAPALAIGLHLNLTEGRPLAPPDTVAAILDADGNLLRSPAALVRKVRLSEAARRAAARELEAQVLWARDRGLRPSHVDSHKHVHLAPALLATVVDLARRHGIRAMRTTAEVRLPNLGRFLPRGLWAGMRQWALERIARRWAAAAKYAVREAGLRTTDWFFGVRATGAISADLVVHLLRHAPDGTGELMVHPGLADPSPPRQSRLGESRPRELAALCDERVRRAAEEYGWTWTTYKDLQS